MPSLNQRVRANWTKLEVSADGRCRLEMTEHPKHIYICKYIYSELRVDHHVSVKYEAVRNWIMNGGPVNGGRFAGRPLLFCHHSWAQKKKMSDPAFDNQGQTFDDVNGNIVRI